MFKYNILFLYRNLIRDRSLFFINLIGLSSGLVCAILIYLWVNDELHIDKFHEKDKQLFQVMQVNHSIEKIITTEPTPGILSMAMKEELPEIEYATSVIPASWFEKEGILTVGSNNIKAHAQFVGKDFFNMFTYPLIQGDKNLVLSEKNAILISDELAIKLFNTTENIIGKTIEWNQEMFSGLYLISGVFKKPPSNSTDQFDLMFNYELFLEKNPKLENWYNSDPYTYIVLKNGTNTDQFNAKIKNFLKVKDKNSNNSLILRRYSDKYLYGKFENGVQSGGRIAYVRLFSIIAILILIIACINYMNLTTAKASKRLKEIGIKKVLGANRKKLIIQYYAESLLISIISLTVAIILVVSLLPQFNEITGKHLRLGFETGIVLSVLGITLFTSIISGSYPAIYVSGFNPVTVLKGKINIITGTPWVRKGLVIFQFAISVLLIVSVLVVYKQIAFIQNKSLGYNRDNIIYFPIEVKVSYNLHDYKEGEKYEKSIEAFLLNVKNTIGVINVSNFWQNIVDQPGGTIGVDWEGKTSENKIDFACLSVGYDFIETLGIEMKEGRTFLRSFGSDNSAIIFNEAAIKSMGIKNPIGKVVTLWGKKRQIIGVTKNFHCESLYKSIRPLFFIYSLDQNSSNIMVKLKTGIENETLERLNNIYKEFNNGAPFEYKFLDQDYQTLYLAEKRVSILAQYFAGIAIIISCLGLYGLAAFTTERKRKEIGVRKVFGSNELNIIYLLSCDFTKQVLISILIALPVSYLIARQWLNGFAYRTKLEWWFFTAAALMALGIAILTVSWQSWKAANTNPSLCLKDE